VEPEQQRRPDPQWDFTLVIRSALERGDTYVAEVDTRDAQAMVDIRWAARQAGRLLGVAVEVHVSAPYGHANSTSTVTLRGIEVEPSDRAMASEGLQRLLDAVLDARGAPATLHLVPEPRPSELAVPGGVTLPPRRPLR